MLDGMEHMPHGPHEFHLSERFVGKLAMIHRVYEIPKTKEFMTKIRKCIRAEEQLRKDL